MNPTGNIGGDRPIDPGGIAAGSDSLVDEVRRIRGAICERFGHDVDRLCDHLEAVGQEYDARRGVFASVTAESAARVVEGWGEDAHRRDDPMVDEVRAIRRKLSADHRRGDSSKE